jgi:branched-chain amino acid transport system permease protein
MSNLLDLLLAGLATGAIYAIVAVGFTLLWQTSQTINSPRANSSCCRHS